MVVDNLSNSKETALERVQEIAGKSLAFRRVDLLDAGALDEAFAARPVDAVIHFAALKAVGESARIPCVTTTTTSPALSLCSGDGRGQGHELVFSSSATVYGDPAAVPIREDSALASPIPTAAPS